MNLTGKKMLSGYAAARVFGFTSPGAVVAMGLPHVTKPARDGTPRYWFDADAVAERKQALIQQLQAQKNPTTASQSI